MCSSAGLDDRYISLCQRLLGSFVQRSFGVGFVALACGVAVHQKHIVDVLVCLILFLDLGNLALH